MAPRDYPPEFRRRVVALVEGDRKVAEVAAELGVSEQTIYTWRRQERRRGRGEVPAPVSMGWSRRLGLQLRTRA